MASMLSFPLPKLSTPSVIAKAAASSAPVTSSPAAAENAASLEQKFGRKGIKFLDSPGDVPTVELTVRNGSSVKLHIPTAHVTSYKPKVYWKDDGFEEVLYTIPPKGVINSSSNSKGGIGLVLNELSDQNPKGSILKTPPQWTVKDADNDSIDAVQIELSSTSGTLELTFVVTLYPLSVATAVIVKNNGRKAVNLAGAILTHFLTKRRRGAGVEGLRSFTYTSLPPLSSQYEILSPSEAMKTEDPGWFSFGWEPEKKPGEWTTQEDKYTVMKHKMSRVYGTPPAERLKKFYNTPPSNYEILDKGRALFFRVIRMGFDDIYLSGPGSLAEKYGNGYFICTGPASMLVPIVVNPGEEWRGAQVIEHDNL
ncbi:OLC1v1038251C1 [Oldenlandia corymbosa var. corymbosa]|uniref:OLC1v1038251C1 n=1 Tax=Oldenlandia corymbosa var. corymbosa TaxID=529605 RepID=A0AAV1D0L0_OLDCO|nr:OLC1v1038251C1 [Oldenlandia corymbosa var. corymbosa]